MQKCLVFFLLAAASASSPASPDTGPIERLTDKPALQAGKQKNQQGEKTVNPKWDSVWLQAGVTGQSTPVPLTEALRALIPERLTVILKSDVDAATAVTWGPGTIITALNDVTSKANTRFAVAGNGYIVIGALPMAAETPLVNIAKLEAAGMKSNRSKRESGKLSDARKESDATSKTSRSLTRNETLAAAHKQVAALASQPARSIPSMQTPVNGTPLAGIGTGTVAATPLPAPSAVPNPAAPAVGRVATAVPVVAMPVPVPGQASPETIVPPQESEGKAAADAVPAQTWWVIHKGQKLSDGFADWGKKAKVDVVWDTSIIRAKEEVEIFGTFDEALLKFLQGANNSGVSLRAKNYLSDGKRKVRIWEKN